MRLCRGSRLKPHIMREALSTFADRYTGDHVPEWARAPMPDGSTWPMQFADDGDWLANTFFWLTRKGTLMHANCKCYPTWPMDPDLTAMENHLKSRICGKEHFRCVPDRDDGID